MRDGGSCREYSILYPWLVLDKAGWIETPTGRSQAGRMLSMHVGARFNVLFSIMRANGTDSREVRGPTNTACRQVEKTNTYHSVNLWFRRQYLPSLHLIT
jgi:hypothetical protein